MKRILGIAVALVLIIAVGALVWLARSIDGIVARKIEQVGSELLGTDVSVDGVSIDLRGGKGSIDALRVHNPEGFSSSDAFALKQVVIGIELGSLRESPIVLTEVTVREPDVLAEANTRGLNLDVLRGNLSESSASEADAEAAEEGEPTRLRIQRFQVEGGTARSDTTALGGRADEVPIPALSLRDLEGTPGELGQRILRAWLDRIAVAVAKHQAKRALGDAVEEGKEKLGEALGELFE